MHKDNSSQNPMKSSEDIAKPTMSAYVNQIAKLLNSQHPNSSTEPLKDWSLETDTSLYNKILSIARMLRSQKQD